jgi:drug/metabolite transporter (DMT)-like permease
MNPTLAALFSEWVLSLYPILIKTVHTNVFSQLLARFAVFPILAGILGPSSDIAKIWGNPFESLAATLNGMLNLGHVATSYLSYTLLPAGTAVALFYLYPLMNVLAGVLLFGESLSPLSLLCLAMAVAGVYFIATQKSKTANAATEESDTNHRWGVVMGLLAAFTETMIFIFIRWNKDAQRSPFYAVQHLYPAGLAALLLIAFKRPETVETSPTRWISLLGFNSILGFTGYLSRFYAIPKLSTIVFSLLSFMGVAFGYLWGILFTDERPTKWSMVGGGLIASAVTLLRLFSA